MFMIQVGAKTKLKHELQGLFATERKNSLSVDMIYP